MDVLQRLLDLDRRLDAWARAMCSGDPADAAEPDRSLWRGPLKWVALAVAGVAPVTGLVYAVSPAMGWTSAFLMTAGVGTLIFMVVASPYYGYRKISGSPWRLYAKMVGATVVSAVVALLAVMLLDPSRTPAPLMHDKLVRAVALSVLLGVAVASITTAIARMRLREVTLRSERIAAEAERERLARQTVQAELKLLQAQVEPHFLFNTLANVRQLMQSGSREALPMFDHLIDYLRRALPEMRSASTTLGREAELARAYLEIMRMRMGGGLRFSIDLAPELRDQAFPPFMVMTLVENAVKHGIAPRGGGEVRILATRREDRILVCVADDGRGLGGELGQGVGLANVRERLRALHGEGASLALESGAQGGTVARVEVPA